MTKEDHGRPATRDSSGIRDIFGTSYHHDQQKKDFSFLNKVLLRISERRDLSIYTRGVWVLKTAK